MNRLIRPQLWHLFSSIIQDAVLDVCVHASKYGVRACIASGLCHMTIGGTDRGEHHVIFSGFLTWCGSWGLFIVSSLLSFMSSLH